MSQRLKLACLSQIPEDSGLVVTTPDGRELALFRRGDEAFALSNSCPHEGGPIAEGSVENGEVSCPWHGWKFSLENGSCQTMPGEDLEKYHVVVIDGIVYLEE